MFKGNKNRISDVESPSRELVNLNSSQINLVSNATQVNQISQIRIENENNNNILDQNTTGEQSRLEPNSMLNNKCFSLLTEVEEKEDKHILCEIMLLTCVILRCFGLYHKKEDSIFMKAYCVFSLIIQWVNVIKFFTVYSTFYGTTEVFSATLVLKLVTHIWFFVVAISSTILFINQEKVDREAKYIRELNLMFQHHSNLNKVVRTIRLRIKLFTLVSFLFSLFNSAAILISYFGPPAFSSAFSLMLCPFQNADWVKNSVAYKLVIWIMTTYTSMGWCLVTGYYACHCRMLIELLDDFDTTFRKFILNNKIVSKDSPNLYQREKINIKQNVSLDNNEKLLVCEKEFEILRLRHLKLCSVVRTLNVCYCEFATFAIICYVPIAFLILYIMSNWTGNCVTGLMQILFPFWLVVSLFILYVIVDMAAMVSVKIHGPIKNIFLITLSDYSNSLTFKVNLMIQRLVGDKTGLSVWNIFIIDRGFIMTVAGSILTYFLVVIRFQTSSSNACSN